MASAAIALTRPESQWRHRSWRHELVQWWAPRLALAAPLIVASIIVDGRGFVSAPHAALEANGALARAGGAAGLKWAYPPIPTFLASILPGGALSLAIVSSVLAGVALASLWGRLERRQVPVGLSLLLLGSLAVVPAAWYGASQDLAAFAGLAFLIIALDGFVRFTVDYDTRGGFVAGLMLALAFGCDPNALIYAATLGAAAPLLAHQRYRNEAGATSATLCVLVFPVAAAAGAWAFLEWRFTGATFHTVTASHDLFAFPGGVLSSAAHAVREGVAAALRSPLYLVVGGLLVARRRIAGLGYALPVVGLMVGQWIGLPYSSVSAFMMLTAIAIMTVPARPSATAVRLLGAAAIVQIVVATVTVSTPDVTQYLHVLR
jgi:hypothetical protein